VANVESSSKDSNPPYLALFDKTPVLCPYCPGQKRRTSRAAQRSRCIGLRERCALVADQSYGLAHVLDIVQPGVVDHDDDEVGTRLLVAATLRRSRRGQGKDSEYHQQADESDTDAL
jgi:hypothetical protein